MHHYASLQSIVRVEVKSCENDNRWNLIYGEEEVCGSSSSITEKMSRSNLGEELGEEIPRQNK